MNNKLFFKVWNDLYLYTKINGYINNKNKTISTYRDVEIYNCNWMIENNYCELLFDKVKRCQYITWNPIDPNTGQFANYETYSYFNHINFKNSLVSKSKQFYSNLFKNYSNNFTASNYILKTITTKFIKFNLLVGVQVLFEEYLITSGDTNKNSIFINKDKNCSGYNYLILKSISHHSIETLKYIHNISQQSTSIPLSPQQNNEPFDITIWRKVLSFKEYKYNENIKPSCFYQVLEFIINEMGIKVPTIYPIKELKSSKSSKRIISIHLLNIHLFEITVGDLIDWCKVIYIFKDYFKQYLESLSNKTYKIFKQAGSVYNKLNELMVCEKPNEILTIVQLDEIKTQLCGMDTSSLLVSDIDKSNKELQYLFKMVIPFTGLPYILTNLSFYQIKYNDYNPNLDELNCTNDRIDPVSFGIYTEIVNVNVFSRKQEDGLFKYCKNDHCKQLEFITAVLDHLMNVSLSPSGFIITNGSLTAKQLFIYLLDIDHIGYIQLSYSTLYKEFQIRAFDYTINEFKNDLFPINVFSLIKSIDTFDYIYNILFNNINQDGSEEMDDTKLNWLLNIKNNILMDHFKLNYSKDYHLFIIKLISRMNSNVTMPVGTLPFSIVQYIINNKFNNVQYQTIWNNCKFYEYKTTEIIWVIQNIPLQDNINNYSFNCTFYQTIEKLINVLYWLSLANVDDRLNLKNIKHFFNFNMPIYYLFHYFNGTLINQFNDCDSTNFLNNSKLVFTEIAKRDDYTTMDIIMNKYFKQEDQSVNEKSKLYDYFNQLAQYGTIKIFKLLVDKYSFILHINPFSIVSWYTPNISLFSIIHSYDNGSNNQLTRSKLQFILEHLVSNGHCDLIIYFKKVILSKKIQTIKIDLNISTIKSISSYPKYYSNYHTLK